jgi:hypothetical protein
MESKSIKLGVYTSYNDSENVNGNIEPAVAVSNRDYLIWLEKAIINPQLFNCPTCIVIKIKKKPIYYKGTLTKIERINEDVNVEKIISDRKHRPCCWIERGPKDLKKFKSVLRIERIKRMRRPPTEIIEVVPPYRPIYIKFKFKCK